jgi:hypothetical protein
MRLSLEEDFAHKDRLVSCRRALGDISNQHRTPNGNQSNADVLGKRKSAGTLKANANSTTPVSAKKARASVAKLATPKRAPPVPEKVEVRSS